MENTQNFTVELGDTGSTGNTGIDLDITGADLMLSGRFQDWDSGVTMGPDLDQLQVRLAVDATSAAQRLIAAPSQKLSEPPPLFAYRGRDVTSVSAGVFQVDGELTSVTGVRPMQMLVETPIQHSPVFLLSFQAKKSDLGPGWTHLLSNVVPFTRRSDDESPAMPAHAWLTMPTLAAA
jgi:hypothetical protein